MTPFRVTFWLGAPICIAHPWLHLDGLVAHLQYEEALGRQYRCLPSKHVVALPDDTQQLFERTNGVCHASVSCFMPDVPMRIETYFKRFEPENFPKSAAARINTARGHFRNYMMRAVLVPCERVVFHANGDMERVAELLGRLTHLGNDGRIGHGKILRMDVQQEEEDCSLLAQGIAMRPIPVRALRRWSDAVPLAWRSPYWASTSVALCAPPGAEVELK